MSTMTADYAQPSNRGYDLRYSTRRSAPRKPVRWAGQIAQRGKGSAKAKILDVSTTGAFVSTYDPASVGSRIEVRFTPPGATQPVAVGGTVRWIGTSDLHDVAGMGVEFDQPLPRVSSFTE